jgi:hypothetical protein
MFNGDALTLLQRNRLLRAMRSWIALLALVFVAASGPKLADEYRQLSKIEPLPKELDRDFEFRKTKTFLLGDLPGSEGARRSARYRGGARDPSVGFEASYRLFGAVTELDKRQRYGHYYDFLWRARRRANLTVRFEYQQEKLRSFTQAREVAYTDVKGSHKTSFAVVGDDFFNDGRVLAWRCVLVENGHVVAEERSYLWEQPAPGPR